MIEILEKSRKFEISNYWGALAMANQIRERDHLSPEMQTTCTHCGSRYSYTYDDTHAEAYIEGTTREARESRKFGFKHFIICPVCGERLVVAVTRGDSEHFKPLHQWSDDSFFGKYGK